MAARLTDKKKKKIIADYIQLGSYTAVAKKNSVSRNTVKSIVLADGETAAKCRQKKEENTADILAYMESQRDDVCAVLKICLAELKKPEKYEKVQPQQIATTMAILIDKYTANSGAVWERCAPLDICPWCYAEIEALLERLIKCKNVKEKIV